jgi:hypothetical protein
MVDVRFDAGFDVLLCLPVSLVLLDSDINTYCSRRGGRIDLESAEHGVVEVSGVFGGARTSDGCGGIVPALLVLLGIPTEEASEGRNDDGEVADGQGDTGLEGANDGLPNAGEANDEDGVGEGGDGGGQGTGEDGDQSETDGGGHSNVSENPEGGDNQENVRKGFGWRKRGM